MQSRGERLGHRLLAWYRGLQPVYGRKRARQKVHRSVEAERNREWTEEHGKKGRRR